MQQWPQKNVSADTIFMKFGARGRVHYRVHPAIPVPQVIDSIYVCLRRKHDDEININASLPSDDIVIKDELESERGSVRSGGEDKSHDIRFAPASGPAMRARRYSS